MEGLKNSVQLMDMPHPNYEYIDSTEEALKHIDRIERYDIIEVDTETTGLDPLSNKVVLLQIGIINKSFVFDVREGNVDARIFKPLLESNKILKLLQNAAFDYEMLKTNFGIVLNRVYDLMIAEQLLNLGLHYKSSLDYMVAKYFSLHMPKDVASSFNDYHQKYAEHQLRYAANDVSILRDIYNFQLPLLQRDGLMRAAKLEFDFIKPLAEMELNGVLLDVPKWRDIINEMIVERDRLRFELHNVFDATVDQTTLFGVSLLNLDSPSQIIKGLTSLGVDVESTDVKELSKHKGNPIVDLLLGYRKHEKFITTYGEAMINRIHPKTGRLHTSFKQMVDTGRLSSSNPNLQNIPKEQRYRSCFMARPGYKLITSDMSQAELRILADYSQDPAFLDAYNSGQDLHTRTASDIFGVTQNEVIKDKKLSDDDVNKKGYRTAAKALNFGLIYGLTKIGLSIRLGVSESKAEGYINAYFSKYKSIKSWLDKASRFAIMHRYSTTISGRRRYYKVPNPNDPKFNRAKGSIERQGRNTPIQGSNADTIKQSMVYITDRIKNYDARLLLTVHDEVVVEAKEDHVEEVGKIVRGCLIDGFGEFFKIVKMEADVLVGDHWLKG